MQLRDQVRGPLYLAMAASIWGSIYVISKVLLTVFDPLELVWLRYLIALAALGALGLATRQNWRIAPRDLPLVFAVGLIGYSLSIWAQFLGTQYSSAQLGSVITSATPAFMVLFARWLLNETITLQKGLAVALATAGVLCIVGIDDLDAGTQLGVWVLVLAALTWALMSVLVKRIPARYPQLVVTAYAMLVALLTMTPLVANRLPGLPALVCSTPQLFAGVLYLGIVSTAGAFYLWNRGLQLTEASRGGLYFFFQPLVGTLLGWLLLGETVGLGFWIGAALILIGVFLSLREQ